MQEKILSPQRQPEERKEKKFLGVPLTENMRTGLRYLGPIVAIAALELGFGFYSECNRTKKAEIAQPAATSQAQTADMPAPTYGWIETIRKGVESLSRGGEYTGQ